MTVAPWTILSSRAAIASGRCLPSAFGIYVRRDGCGRYAPRRTRSCRSSSRRLKVRLVVLPCHAVYAGGGFALERVERLPECIDVDMVEKRGELFLLPLPCSLPYAVERLGHTIPALRPVCALLSRIPLGPWPWLHHLRRRLPSFVRRLHGYYASSQTSPDRSSVATASRLPAADHSTLWAYGRPGDLPVPVQGACVHARVFDHAGPDRRLQ